MDHTVSSQRILVSGVVQGVGFRPYVYSLAQKHRLSGWVRNTSSGVEILVEGNSSELDQFIRTLRNSPPPLARIDSLRSFRSEPNGYSNFEILTSQLKEGDFIPISADIGICQDCRNELFDPKDRRYRYPFINCTNCGPRFTIIKDIPYDRPKTTMAGFEMCPECKKEYNDPLNRRFHAQPVACPVCGPQICLKNREGDTCLGEIAIQEGRHLLASGKILAIKGLGGFHLACDANNPSAIAELRTRKRRTQKPFALMAFSLDQVNKYCSISNFETHLMTCHQNPIVLLEKLPSCPIPDDVAPGQNTLGVMLAYTPLHLLLLEPAAGYPDIFVMTSGNLSEEPIAYQDEDARNRLFNLADGFLYHNRPIHMRVDDSVIREFNANAYFIRRSRGYSPDTITLKTEVTPVLATGGELKNTFCITRGQYAFMSHHIGDMENYETLQSFEQAINHYQKLFRISPQVIGCDLHPDYMATRYAEEKAIAENLPLVKIQHHHAHLSACLVDNGWESDDPVIGFIFDGTGYGVDHTIWGGEVLIGGHREFIRKNHLRYIPIPGGDITIKKPSRMALAYLWSAGLDWNDNIPACAALCYEEKLALRLQLEKKLHTPLTSSMGRLFDAVSSLIGLQHFATYEGQAAIELELIADPQEIGFYSFEINGELINPIPVIHSILSDLFENVPPPIISARFHNSISHLVHNIARSIRQETGIITVALSGGVWQNMRLLRQVTSKLSSDNFAVLYHHQVPTNDGGIALGQAIIADHQYKQTGKQFLRSM